MCHMSIVPCSWAKATASNSLDILSRLALWALTEPFGFGDARYFVL